MTKWDQIKKECPKLYQDGIIFECGIGWYSLILDLSLKIETLLEENSTRNKIPSNEEVFYFEMFATQVKEKYGSLRFYMNCSTNEIDKLIEEAELLSTEICERCGKTGKMRNDYWISVLCDECYDFPSS